MSARPAAEPLLGFLVVDGLLPALVLLVLATVRIVLTLAVHGDL